MLKSIKSSFKETAIYGLGNIAVKIVGLILIPLYTDPRFFTINDFGILGIFEISALLLTAIMASALPQGLTRWYWDKDFKNNQKGIFFMSLSTQIIVSLFFCLLLIPLSESLSVMIFSHTDLAEVIKLVIISSAVQAVNNIINTLMRLQSKSMLYSLTNLMKLVIVLSLTIFFIISEKMGLKGIFLAQVIGNTAITLMLLGYSLKNMKLFFDSSIFRNMSAYGFPLLLANVSAASLTVIDRFSLNSLAVLKSVALYTLAFKVTSVLKLVLVDSMKLAIAPMIFKRIDSPDIKRFYPKVLLYSSYVIMFGVVVVSMFSYEVIKVIADSKEFWGAVVIVPILALSVFFINLKEITVYGLHIARKTKIIGYIVVFSAIVSLALNLLLIPVWDIKGAAAATLLSQLIYWYACYYFSQKVYYVPHEIRKILLLLVTGTVLSFSGLLLGEIQIIPRLLIKTGIVLSFPFILYLFNFYEPVELQYIKGFVSKWSKISKLRYNIKSIKGLSDDV